MTKMREVSLTEIIKSKERWIQENCGFKNLFYARFKLNSFLLKKMMHSCLRNLKASPYQPELYNTEERVGEGKGENEKRKMDSKSL